MRPRRKSAADQTMFASSWNGSGKGSPQQRTDQGGHSRRVPRNRTAHASSGEEDDHAEDINDRTPLIGTAFTHKSPAETGYGLFKNNTRGSDTSVNSPKQHHTRRGTGPQSFPDFDQDFDVNNPPSVPGSPQVGAQYDDVMVGEGNYMTRSPDNRRNPAATNKDALIDIDGDTANERDAHSAPPSPRLRPQGLSRHRSAAAAEGDVCFPADTMSEMAEDDVDRSQSQGRQPHGSRKRNRNREWPQFWALEEWSREEKEERAGERRATKIREPVFVDGRLRAPKAVWHREEAVPYRYTYFNEEFESTIHAQTISELVQPGGSFRELFVPDPPELSDSSDSDEDEDLSEVNQKDDSGNASANAPTPRSAHNGDATGNGSRLSSMLSEVARNGRATPSAEPVRESSSETPRKSPSQSRPKGPKPKKYGTRPTWWLDVMSPTDQEMRVLCKTFGIHALTSEDIMMQEAREKVELFRNYYFLNYRTFEQDTLDEDYLEPINMYVCVFREGIISFHFSQIPHPANVRRRIRQLTDYLILSSDWISYAIIDDITDVYQPLITNIEEEVDDIDEKILRSFSKTNALHAETNADDEKKSEAGEANQASSGIDMLRRIGECRKKVMSLYRLLGNKADVIKGFAKRCNEQWEVAPRSEIGLYLGDIQDHILTMTSNLSHYETLLSRAHSNYLAQVSIRMNERQEETADVLGKLTVLGTIVLPMNIICGMWGYVFTAYTRLAQTTTNHITA